MSEKSVLSPKFGGGPHGVGDPDDLTLRKVEMEVLIPKKMRDIAKVEKCSEEVAAFTECCKESSLRMVFACQAQNTLMKGCLERWYNDEQFKARCKNEYLAERSDFRRTGVNQNKINELKEKLRREIAREQSS